MSSISDLGQFINKTVPVTKVHGDLNQEVITITVDRLKVILFGHARAIEERKSWIAPLGILATIMVTIFTAQFKDFVFSADTWLAIYIIAAFSAFAWLIKTLWYVYRAVTIGDLVEKIKNQGDG